MGLTLLLQNYNVKVFTTIQLKYVVLNKTIIEQDKKMSSKNSHILHAYI